MNRVRVLLVASHPVQYAAPLYRRYAAHQELDVTVAYCSLEGAEPGFDPGFDMQVQWDVPLLDRYRWVHPCNRSPFPRATGFLGLLNPGLWPLIRRGRFDVVVCYCYRALSFWIAALAAKRSGAVLVLTSDAPTLERPGLGWLSLVLKRWLVPRVFRWADAVFAPSTPAARLFVALGLPSDRVFLTPFAVDIDRFAATGERERLRRQLGIRPDEVCVAFVGKLIPRKRAADAIDAVARADGAHLLIAGAGPLLPRLEALASASAPGRVHFLGFVNQTGLPDVYAASDVLVVPSDYDPFPVVVMEAMALGRPIIASGVIGSIGDLVLEGETGLVYPVGDTDGLADRIRVLAADPKLRRAMGERARRRIAEWGPEQNVAAFVRACLALADRRASSRR